MKLKTSSITVLLFSLIIILSAIPAWSSVIYVSKSGNNANNGSTWGLAKLTVQAGLDAASSGDEVWVAAGTYVECITMKVGVKLYGGFVGSESQLSERNGQSHTSTLDGNHAGSVVTVPTGATSTTRIDGFAIRNGTGTGSSHYGGGIYCVSSSPTIANNHITDNDAGDGGGIYVSAGSPIIEGNTITNNEALQSYDYYACGGGIYCSQSSAHIQNNYLYYNSGVMSGGIGILEGSNILISGNIIANCSSYWGAGGIFGSSTNVVISDNIISYNTETAGGMGGIEIEGNGEITGNTITFNSGSVGGIFIPSSTDDFTIKYNYIYGNSGGCGAINSGSNVKIIGNYIASNESTSEDSTGVMVITSSSEIIITNNTIVYNTAPSGGHGVIYASSSNPIISNNIIAFNSAGIELSDYDSCTINNNDVYSNGNNYIGVSAGTGDISVDPLFASLYINTFHINYDSPCKDAGSNNAAGLSELNIDLDGDARINGNHVDIGADEVWTTISSAKLRGCSEFDNVHIEDAIVTAEFGNYLYIESPDRSSGIRVDHSTTNTYAIGTRVNVDGWSNIVETGEKCITMGYDTSYSTYIYPTITITGTGVDTSSFPLGMNNRTLGGGEFQYYYDESSGLSKGQKGIAGAYGWNNIGLLVRIYGNVTSIGTDYLYINDGSDIKDGTQTSGVDNVGIKVMCDPTGYAVGDHLIITGISSCFMDASWDLQRLVLTRGTSDITKVTTGETAVFTVYGRTSGSADNWISMLIAPFNPDPLSVFSTLSRIDNRLERLDPITNNVIAYYEFDPEALGSLLLGEGYAIQNDSGSNYTVSYTGFPDGLRDGSGLPVDMSISLPGMTGQEGGYHWIGQPFNYNVLWTDCLVTNGLETLPVTDAINKGWLDGGWAYLDATTNGTNNVDPDEIAGSAYLEPGRMYQVFTHKGNLSVIIPADRIAPTFSNIASSPRTGRYNDPVAGNVTITFTVSEELKTVPTVTVNGNNATNITHTGLDYSCTYTVQEDDPVGPATIVITGMDMAGNEAQDTNADALLIGVVTAYTYDSNGNWSMINANGTKTEYSYDERYRLKEVEHLRRNTNGVFSMFKQVNYNLDGVGNRVKLWLDNDEANLSTVYTYDVVNRLTSAASTNYTYDWVGNRTSPGSCVFSIVDILTSGYGNTYSYSLSGNLTGVSGASSHTYTYDSRGLLKTAN